MTPITLNIVTAVSRLWNLPLVHRSIDSTIENTGIELKWILVFDAPSDAPPAFNKIIASTTRFRIEKVFWPNGPCVFGIRQKNMGIDRCDRGFYYLLDDDNIVHPDFFNRISTHIRENPQKPAFGFSQRRWDHWGTLKAVPERMKPFQIDNSMFVVHTDFIGDKRYDLSKAGTEDGHFFMELHEKDSSAWVFIDEILAFYNYLSHFPTGKET